MYLSFALKIVFSNFFSLRKKFLSICGLRILIICLVALNTERLGYVRNPRSLMEGTETLCRDDIGIYLEAPNISD